MSWMKKFYGCEAPSLFRTSVISIFYISLALCLYGWWTDFIPSSAWESTGLYASISLSAIYCPAFYYLATTQKPLIKIFTSHIGRAFQFCFISLIVVIMFWGVVVHGAADLVTQVIGKPKTIEAELSKIYLSSRRGCDYRLEGYAIQGAMPSHICISENFFSKLPAQRIFQLQGEASFLGFHVSNIYTE